MLTRHSPLHALGRAEVGGGWWVKATASLSRGIPDGRPGCPLTHQPSIASHCGGRSPLGRASARRMSTKKVRGSILGTQHEDRRGGKTGRPRPEMPNRHPPCPECGETLRSKLLTTDGLAPSQPLSFRARLPIESHLVILRNPQTISKKIFLTA